MKPILQRWFRIIAIGFGAVALAFGLYALVAEPGVLRRVWGDLVERPSGPMAFRFLLQPIMAIAAAWKDGAKDAATGRSPYFWTVLTDPVRRHSRLVEGLRATGKILAIGVAMDLAYQGFVLKHFYPVEAILVALLLAFVPYLLLRGPVARFLVARRRP
ncbi:hypothetical protein ACFW0P_04435 [Lysobacter soli]|jgi:hypothetical protein|uniref:hypothetical protein n=1 Tax=Lysobacter soli TaxID=453783 RepID=UPI0036B91DDF